MYTKSRQVPSSYPAPVADPSRRKQQDLRLVPERWGLRLPVRGLLARVQPGLLRQRARQRCLAVGRRNLPLGHRTAGPLLVHGSPGPPPQPVPPASPSRGQSGRLAPRTAAAGCGGGEGGRGAAGAEARWTGSAALVSSEEGSCTPVAAASCSEDGDPRNKRWRWPPHPGPLPPLSYAGTQPSNLCTSLLSQAGWNRCNLSIYLCISSKREVYPCMLLVHSAFNAARLENKERKREELHT